MITAHNFTATGIKRLGGPLQFLQTQRKYRIQMSQSIVPLKTPAIVTAKYQDWQLLAEKFIIGCLGIYPINLKLLILSCCTKVISASYSNGAKRP